MKAHPEWTRAYARQAQADIETWGRLQYLRGVPECHRLQFLQMACEKLTKAFLCARGSEPEVLQTSHAYIARNLPLVFRHLLSTGLIVHNPQWALKVANQLAGEIELLAPAVRRGGLRRDNCEYPWKENDSKLYSPLDWTFAPTGRLASRDGRVFVKLLRLALVEMLRG